MTAAGATTGGACTGTGGAAGAALAGSGAACTGNGGIAGAALVRQPWRVPQSY